MPVYFFGQNIVSGRQDQGTVVSNLIETNPIPGISGLDQWYVGDLIPGADGDPVNSIEDQSSEGNNATTRTTSGTIILKKNILNGHAVFRGAGLGSISAPMTNAGVRTLIMCGNWLGVGTPFQRILNLAADETYSSPGRAGIYYASSSQMGFYIPSETWNTDTEVPFVLAISWDAQNVHVRFNGEPVAFTGLADNISDFSASFLLASSTASEFSNGQIAEWASYSEEVSLNDIQRVEDYLSETYGVGLTRSYLWFPATGPGNTIPDQQLFAGTGNGTVFQLASPAPLYTAPSGLIIRDPSPIVDGGFTYIAHTAQGSLNYFSIIRSADRTTWTHYTDVDCSDVSPTDTWAPEWFEDGGTRYILISLKFGGSFYIYYKQASSDLLTWGSSTQILDHNGDPINEIDPFIKKVGSTYYFFTSTSGIIKLRTSSSPFTGYSDPTTIGMPSPGGEGFCALQLGDGTWEGYADTTFLAGPGLKRWVSPSIDGPWTLDGNCTFSGRTGFGHGTPLRLQP